MFETINMNVNSAHVYASHIEINQKYFSSSYLILFYVKQNIVIRNVSIVERTYLLQINNIVVLVNRRATLKIQEIDKKYSLS